MALCVRLSRRRKFAAYISANVLLAYVLFTVDWNFNAVETESDDELISDFMPDEEIVPDAIDLLEGGGANGQTPSDDETNVPDEDWVKARQDMQRSDDGRSKVILFSYMRGGSTLFSDVFNIDPNSSILWYEALDGFHANYSGLPFYSNPLQLLYHLNLTRRSKDEETILAVTEYLQNILNCSSFRLPIETLSHRFISASKALKLFWNCMKVHDTNQVYLKRRSSAALCEKTELGSTTEDLRLFEIGRCRSMLRFLRRLNSDELRAEGAERTFHQYLEQFEVRDTRLAIYKICGEVLKLPVRAVLNDEKVYHDEDVERNSIEDSNLKSLYESLSIERCQTLRNDFLQLFTVYEFMHQLDERSRTCRNILDEKCSKVDIVVAGIHRISFADLESLIRRMPEVQVVFYVRDPRAMAVSRSDALTRQMFLLTSDWTAVNESLLLCRRMWEDLEAKKRLERRYPSSIVTIRYEDFILDPKGTAMKMYGRFLKEIPAGFDQWVNETMHSGKYDGVYGIRRQNSRKHISGWRSKVAIQDAQAMTRNCVSVLKELDYLS